jgi:hypothetical protein
MKRILLSTVLALCTLFLAGAQVLPSAESQGQPKEKVQRVQKRYNIFFRINSPEIDRTFQDNARTLDQMKHDIDTTLAHDGAVPDSLLILSTASPDGSYKFNKWLAGARAESTEKLLLEMFPEFENATIIVEYLEEDWDGLRQVLRLHPEFPQREEMLAVIDAQDGIDDKEAALRALKQGWRYLTNNYIHALRNSSITLSVIGPPDEYTRAAPVVPMVAKEYTPTFTAPQKAIPPHRQTRKIEWRKMILAGRTNLLVPGLNFGVEIPIKDNWSVGIDYWYPWAVSKHNKWCGEMLGWFVDAKYWFPGEKYQWTRTERLQGHAVGLYAGAGYYDYQNISKGNQGEYIDLGVDYTFALPIAQNRLRLEFNFGVGFIRTWYRPYHPSSDYEDLIKEPGIRYKSTNFFGPTRAGVSLVVPIIVKTKFPKIYKVEGGVE